MNKDSNELSHTEEKLEQEVEILDNRVGEIEREISIHSVQMSGPLPPPEILQGYENIQPGLADRIVKMAEKEQEARHQDNTKIIDFETKTKSRDSLIGIIAGFLIVLAAFLSAIYLAMNNKETTANVLIGVTLVGLVGSILQHTRIKERPQKKEDSNSSEQKSQK